MKKLFWHIAQSQPEDEALAFEIVEIDKIIPYPKELDQEIYHKLIKNCLAQSDFNTLPALLEGAIALEEFDHAEFIKQRMKEGKT